MNACSLVLGVFLAAAPAASNSAVAPWDWSDEQRLAERLDVASIRERASRAATEPYGIAPPRTNAAVVIGRRNPELFLPFELFTRLIGEAFDENPQRRNANRARIAEAAGGADALPPSFWTTLESATAPFLAQQREQHALFARLNTAASDADRAALRQQIAAAQRDECALRAAALTTATSALGRTTLYRVLYRAIAPEMTMIAPEPESMERLRRLEGGCR